MSIGKFFAPLVRRIGPFGIGRKLTLGFGTLAGMTLLVVALGMAWRFARAPQGVPQPA